MKPFSIGSLFWLFWRAFIYSWFMMLIAVLSFCLQRPLLMQTRQLSWILLSQKHICGKGEYNAATFVFFLFLLWRWLSLRVLSVFGSVYNLLDVFFVRACKMLIAVLIYSYSGCIYFWLMANWFRLMLACYYFFVKVEY